MSLCSVEVIRSCRSVRICHCREYIRRNRVEAVELSRYVRCYIKVLALCDYGNLGLSAVGSACFVKLSIVEGYILNLYALYEIVRCAAVIRVAALAVIGQCKAVCRYSRCVRISCVCLDKYVTLAVKKLHYILLIRRRNLQRAGTLHITVFVRSDGVNRNCHAVKLLDIVLQNRRLISFACLNICYIYKLVVVRCKEAVLEEPLRVALLALELNRLGIVLKDIDKTFCSSVSFIDYLERRLHIGAVLEVLNYEYRNTLAVSVYLSCALCVVDYVCTLRCKDVISVISLSLFVTGDVESRYRNLNRFACCYRHNL